MAAVMNKFFIRTFYSLFCAGIFIVLIVPLILYYVGLRDIDALPSPPAQLISREQQAIVWQQAGGSLEAFKDAEKSGTSIIEKSDPYWFTFKFLKQQSPSTSDRIIWQVARQHLYYHRVSKSMSAWHLSGAALCIWMSRNWTSEQILSEASQIKINRHTDERIVSIKIYSSHRGLSSFVLR